jgi:hypothetical protein
MTAEHIEQIVTRGFTYYLPDTPPFLSEQLALATAQQALSQVVPDRTTWTPIENVFFKASVAPDGTPDVSLIRDVRTNANAGSILFESTQHTNKVWAVNVQLQGNRLSCTVSRAR